MHYILLDRNMSICLIGLVGLLLYIDIYRKSRQIYYFDHRIRNKFYNLLQCLKDKIHECYCGVLFEISGYHVAIRSSWFMITRPLNWAPASSVLFFLHLHEIVDGLYFNCSLSVCVGYCIASKLWDSRRLSDNKESLTQLKATVYWVKLESSLLNTQNVKAGKGCCVASRA